MRFVLVSVVFLDSLADIHQVLERIRDEFHQIVIFCVQNLSFSILERALLRSDLDQMLLVIWTASAILNQNACWRLKPFSPLTYPYQTLTHRLPKTNDPESTKIRFNWRPESNRLNLFLCLKVLLKLLLDSLLIPSLQQPQKHPLLLLQHIQIRVFLQLQSLDKRFLSGLKTSPHFLYKNCSSSLLIVNSNLLDMRFKMHLD